VRAANSDAYIVAEADSAKAIDLIRTKVADPADRVEDLGRVSSSLLRALQLTPGEFMRTHDSRTLRPI
jgi:hypothetical protein